MAALSAGDLAVNTQALSSDAEELAAGIDSTIWPSVADDVLDRLADAEAALAVALDKIASGLQQSLVDGELVVFDHTGADPAGTIERALSAVRTATEQGRSIEAARGF
jgi:hypothetical protein